MVNMGMGQENKIYFGSGDRQLLIDKKVFALLHTTVNNTLFVTHFKQSTTAGYFVSGAKKCYFHKISPLLYFVFYNIFYTT